MLITAGNAFRYCLGAGTPEALWVMGTGKFAEFIDHPLVYLLCLGESLYLQG